MFRRLLLAAASLSLLAMASVTVTAANTGSSSPTPERPTRAPVHPNVYPTDQIPLLSNASGARVARTASGTSTPAPFLTRPYWGPHGVNSIFDHCMPTGYYVADGKICGVDGSVALESYGVDPTFTLGYATTPGGSTYAYYDGHNGWDLGLSMDTPVLAAADGTVTYSGWDDYGWGNTILIDHGNGFATRYAHLDKLQVSVGQAVSRGQQIGLSGTTGNSTGPHLHFGVYRTDMTLANGDMVAIDPWGWQATTTDPWPYDEGDLWLTGNPTDPVPDPPTAVAAALQCGGVVVSWTAPSFAGGDGVTGYQVTASPGGATETIEANRTAALFPGLTPGTAYTFTVVATSSAGSGQPSAASSAITAPVATAADNSCHLYTLSGYGVVHPVGLAPEVPGAPNFGWDIARSFALFPDGSGGYVLDGWGGMHQFGSAPAMSTPFYWPGWDIVRSLALAPWATAAKPAGWLLDGFGGIHPFGGAPAVSSSYFPGWDIARQLVIEPGSTPSSVAGYVLDGWGGLHAFGGAVKVTNNATWPHWDIAHAVALLPTSSAAAPAGYTLDGWGGLHPFGSAPSVQPGGYWPGWDITRSLTMWTEAPAGQPSGWVLDAWGGLHAFGAAPQLQVTGYWPGWDIARGVTGSGSGGGARGKQS